MNSITYPYLSDLRFLKELDELNIKEQFVKIIVLDWLENPIANIEGRVSGGSMNLDGSSAVRRSGSITFICDDEYYNVLDVNNLISINKKIKIEIGYANTTDKYTEYDKIWFPQGVFVIINPSITHNNQGLSIAISFKDKMCLLNGECGGVLPASVTFHEREEEDGTITRVTYYQIIRELVSEFGGEQLGKIIINDVPMRIKKVMKWVGDEPITLQGTLYSISKPFVLDEKGLSDNFSKKELCSSLEISLQPRRKDDKNQLIDNEITVQVVCETESPKYNLVIELYKNEETSFFENWISDKLAGSQTVMQSFSIKNDQKADINVKAFLKEATPTYYSGRITVRNDNPAPIVDHCQPQEDIGYIYTDFCPTSDLVGNAGQNVVTILDNIKKQLGNYEYFYDIDGNFVFQEIRNYLNTSQSTSEFQSIQYTPDGYLFQPNASKSVYSFNDSALITAYQNTPQYANIKNDYIVWGIRESASGAKLPIRYHLALDTKPAVGNKYNCITKTDEFGHESITHIMQNTTEGVLRQKNRPRVGRPSAVYDDTNSYYQFKATSVGKSSTFTETADQYIFSFDNIPLSKEKWYLLEFHGFDGNYSNIAKTNLLPRIITDSRSPLIASTYNSNTPVGQQAYVEPIEMCFYFDNSLQKRNALQSVELAKDSNLASFSHSSYVTVYSFDTLDSWKDLGKGNSYKTITTQDYRTELYIQGIMAETLGENKNRYYAELASEWPKLFKLQEIPNDTDIEQENFLSAPVLFNTSSDSSSIVEITLNYGYVDNVFMTITRIANKPYEFLPAPSRSGYIFIGWFTENNGGGTKINENTIVPEENTTLYAHWRKEIKYGDINDDGLVDLRDAVLLSQYLAEWEVKVNKAAADCNGDDMVDTRDAVLLAQYLAEWDVTLGPQGVSGTTWEENKCSVEGEIDKEGKIKITLTDNDGNNIPSSIFFFAAFEIQQGEISENSSAWNIEGNRIFYQHVNLNEGFNFSDLTDWNDISFNSSSLVILKPLRIECAYQRQGEKTGLLYSFDPTKAPTISNGEEVDITVQIYPGNTQSGKIQLGTKYMNYLNKIELPPTYQGQYFEGWYWHLGEEGQQKKVNTDDIITIDNMNEGIISANWVYGLEIHFNAMGGAPAPEDQFYLYDGSTVSYKLSDTLPQREGYKFIGWKDEQGNQYKPGAIITIAQEAQGKSLILKLDAIWEFITLSVIDVPIADDLSKLDLDYYLDLIDVQSKISEFNIPSISARSKVWSDDAVNCIFEKTIPDVVLIEAGKGQITQEERNYCEKQGDSYYQVPSSIYNALAGGGYQNSAFNAIRDILYQYTNYNESITLTTLPIYYLEPNTRITVEDEKSSIHGDYMIKTISRPFDCNGTMQITATKALERF